MTPSPGNRSFSARTVRGTSPLRVPGLRSLRGLELRGDHREQRERWDAEAHAALGVAEQEVDALARDARQRRHRLLALRAVQHEHRIDQVVGREAMLAHQPAREFVAPHPPHARCRVASGKIEAHVTSRKEIEDRGSGPQVISIGVAALYGFRTHVMDFHRGTLTEVNGLSMRTATSPAFLPERVPSR